MRIVLSLLAVAFLLNSCGDTYSEDDVKKFDVKIQKYLKKKKITDLTKSSSGLYYKIIEKGEGRDIQFKDEVSFTYKGTLLNGVVFDEKKEPITFAVEKLIGCWKEVMLNLKPGGKAFIVSPPQLGYADSDLDGIPKNSILVFELEVTDVN